MADQNYNINCFKQSFTEFNLSIEDTKLLIIEYF
jgi:hypothetical protein